VQQPRRYLWNRDINVQFVVVVLATAIYTKINAVVVMLCCVAIQIVRFSSIICVEVDADAAYVNIATLG